MAKIGVFLFANFTLLDAFGPIEVLSRLEDVEIHYVSKGGGPVTGSASGAIVTRPWDAQAAFDILLVPGGLGTRRLVHDAPALDDLRTAAARAGFVLSVCTGSALLAKAGLLDHRRATSNKLAWDWVVQQGPGVDWVRKARWVVDDKFYTSSGVTAGIDMALGFVRDQAGTAEAERIARTIEHQWNPDGDHDPF